MNLRQELKRLTNQMSQESGWYETDDCDMQHCRKVTENEYDFIQSVSMRRLSMYP